MSNAVNPGSQTLSRGLRILELLADSAEPLSIDAMSDLLGVHRSNTYRLVRTLEQHGLLIRDDAGLLRLGPRLAALAAEVSRDLQAHALPELTAAASELGMTCFVAIFDRGECVTLTSVEPRHTVAAVAQRPGTRHSVAVGAPGRAMLAQLPVGKWPADVSPSVATQVAAGGESGPFFSHDEVIPSLNSVAVPLVIRGSEPAAIGAVYISSEHTGQEIGARLGRVADEIARALGG